MPLEDARRWNARYQQESRDSFEKPRPYLVQHSNLLPRHGLALDVAMGQGGNAGFMLKRGLRVIGVDISIVAIRYAKVVLPELMAIVADLTTFRLPPATFDVIMNFYYLQRDLCPQYVRSLRPGGILIFETLTQEMASIHPEIDPGLLLAPGELRQAFQGLDTLDYREGWTEGEHPKAVASLVARKS